MIRFKLVCFTSLMIVFLCSCKGDSNEDVVLKTIDSSGTVIPESGEDEMEDVNTIVTHSDEVVAPYNANSFDSFLGIEYGTEEKLLTNKLGNFTGGKYSQDSSAFIYNYNKAERVPIEIWVDVKTNKVITLFIEVLSLKDAFEDDVALVTEAYNLSNDDTDWLGLTIPEIKFRMGKPDEEAISEEGITFLAYDSDDFTRAVSFKFYPQQNNICSSISVNWFY